MVIKRAEISSLGNRHELINCQLSGYELKNIPNIKLTDVNHFSAYDLAKYKKIIFTETSIKELEKRY